MAPIKPPPPHVGQGTLALREQLQGFKCHLLTEVLHPGLPSSWGGALTSPVDLFPKGPETLSLGAGSYHSAIL